MPDKSTLFEEKKHFKKCERCRKTYVLDENILSFWCDSLDVQHLFYRCYQCGININEALCDYHVGKRDGVKCELLEELIDEYVGKVMEKLWD